MIDLAVLLERGVFLLSSSYFLSLGSSSSSNFSICRRCAGSVVLSSNAQ